MLEISSFYLCVSKITILWCTVFEWETEFFAILDCFLPLTPPMDPENQNFEKMSVFTFSTYLEHFIQPIKESAAWKVEPMLQFTGQVSTTIFPPTTKGTNYLNTNTTISVPKNMCKLLWNVKSPLPINCWLI